MFPDKRTLLASALVLATMAGCSPKEEAKPDTATVTKTVDPAKLEKKEEAKTPEPTEMKSAEPVKGEPEKPKSEKPDATKKESAEKSGNEKWITTATGLKYLVVKEGKGGKLQRGQTAMVHYRGTFEDGREFDSSYKHGQPYPVPVGVRAVIAGWDEALLTMRVGDKRKLIIPGALAYPNGRDGIAPNTTLLFDIEVLSIQKD